MLKLYLVQDDYIEYLRKFEHKVLDNKYSNRPYVGVVCVVNSINYYVPLASPKPKHLTMKNTKDFHKIAQGKYGALNFNNMIPVVNSALIPLNISSERDINYRYLLLNQYRELIKIQQEIYKKAMQVYALFAGAAPLSVNDAKIKARCCDFLLLEEKMLDYSPKK